MMTDGVVPVQASPVPTMVGTGQSMGPDGKHWVVMQFGTPVGTSVFFLDGEAAEKIGQQLINLGKLSRAGLVLPSPAVNGGPVDPAVNGGP